MRWGVLVLVGLLAVEVLIFCISTVPGIRSSAGFDDLLDGWLQGGAYVTAAAVAVLRAAVGGRWWRLWAWVAGALVLRAAAFVTYLGFVRHMDPVPYPSLADAGWLGMCLMLLAGLSVLVRAHFPRLSISLVLDGLLGALAIGGITLALLYPTLERLTAAGTPAGALATNLAYPIADVSLLLVLFGVLVASRWKAPPSVWMLVAGVAGFAITDTVFLYQSARGAFEPGTPLSALSLVATSSIALAGWARETGADAEREVLPGLVVPSVAALGCLFVLVYGTAEPIPLAAVVLTALGLIAALARTGLAFRDVRGIAEARREARTDELTGLANRRAFNERLQAALRGRPDDASLTLLIVDLDNFKDVNDSLGHHHGDELLAVVAPRLRLALRSDDLLARIGGDEFAVILAHADAAAVSDFAERLQAAVRRPLMLGGRELTPDASIGVAVFPHDGRDASELLKHADLAMYAAKEAHVGYRFFRPEQHQSARERLETVERLRAAIAGGELVLHYQPQVELASGAITGLEALVRWEHPALGLLAPGRFLPQAESGGLMRELTLEVLSRAIRQCGDWARRSMPVSVAVNLSVTNLLDPELPGRIEELLDAHGVPGELVQVELTEDLFMADPVRGGRMIERLRDTGVTICVDDYGTGYSSLGYLRELRAISRLKLDRSFVAGLVDDPRAAAIVESTVALTRSLGIEFVAEGIETEPVRDRLRELGCTLGQGFLFGRPVPADEIRLTRTSRHPSL